jgi:hypothetical protein
LEEMQIRHIFMDIMYLLHEVTEHIKSHKTVSPLHKFFKISTCSEVR